MNRRTNRFSIAVGSDMVTAVVGGSPIEVSRLTGAAPLSIAQAFAEIARRADTAGMAALVDVALMPSVCDVRLVALPPLKPAEAEAVLRREATRHFIGSNEQRVIGVRMPRSTRGTATPAAPVLAAAAGQALLDEITNAAGHHGWAVRRITTAHAAWLAAAAGTARDSTARPRAFAAVEGDMLYVARVENGSPVTLRRTPVRQADAAVSALGGGPGTVLVLAPDSIRGSLAAVLTSAAWSVLPGHVSASATAAANAGAAQLELVTDAHHSRNAERQRSLAVRLTAAAAVLLVLTAFAARWGAQRELDGVRARRAAIRAQVAPLLQLRDSVDNLEARINETNSLFAAGSRMSKMLYEVTMLLPNDAHLTRVNAVGDTVFLEGEGPRAGDVLEALVRAPSLRNVHMDGPVQRELEEGETSLERFTIQATLPGGEAAEAAAKRRVKPPARTIAESSLGEDLR